MPSKKVQAVVYVNSANKAVIFPPVILADSNGNDDIDIVNMTGKAIVVEYPANVFEIGGGNNNIDPNKQIENVPDKGKKTRKVHGNAVTGRYPFKILSFATGGGVEANSDPEFIIE